ncbi:unnamed protein product [Musa hybrid cultivar]
MEREIGWKKARVLMEATRRTEWVWASGGNGERNDGGEGSGGGVGVAVERVLFVKVMTDEQMEILRSQIAVYATISEQLIEMHKIITAYQGSLSGMKLGGIYVDPLMASGGHKLTARQRWTPTSMQLQMLETIFNQGYGTPSKQKIKHITIELSQHGQISESNVYNWFQNRRARSKKMQKMAALPSNSESEIETDEDSPNEKKLRPDKNVPVTISSDPIYNMQISAEVHLLDQTQGIYQLNGSSKSCGSLDQMSYANVLSTPRLYHLMDKFDIPMSFSPFHPGESYDGSG